MLNPRSIPACGELFDIEMIDDPIHRSALACAGNSHSCWIFNINQSVHPRLRGELNIYDHFLSSYGGSSPLTRGTPKTALIMPFIQRFIPAYAGNSSSIRFVIGSVSVHPRLRGELTDPEADENGQIGSSPLTRGTRSESSC